MRFAICLLLNITLLAIITPIMRVKTLTICDQMHKSSKTRFDYAFTMRTKDGDQHYIIKDGYGFQIYNHTDKALMIYDGIRSEKSDDSVIAFAYKETLNHTYDMTCYYKVNKKKFVCHVEYRVGGEYTFYFDLFKCSSKPIDLKRVIAYHPQSYYDRERNEILLVERVVDQTDSNNQRKVWTSYWPKLPTKTMKSTCAEEKHYNKSGIIPKFLSAINKSLEITAILSVDYNGENSAIILFYMNESHKYCITAEDRLSPMCQIDMSLKDYLKDCDNILPKTTVKTNDSQIYIIIIGLIFLICSVCMIFMLCYICYAKHLIRKSEEKRKAQKKYYKYRRHDSNTDSDLNDSESTGFTNKSNNIKRQRDKNRKLQQKNYKNKKVNSKSTKTDKIDLSDSVSTEKTTGFEISDEDVTRFNKSTSHSDETIENKGPKQLMIWKKH